MELTSARTLAAPIDAVWRALHEPATVKQCIPGCEVFERTGTDTYRVVIGGRGGATAARHAGRIAITSATPPASCTLRFDSAGDAAGFANGIATLNLTSPLPDITTLTYFVKAQVDGALASADAALIDNAAARLADGFFMRLAEQVAPQATGTSSVLAAAAGLPPQARRSRDGSRTWTRYIAIAAMLCILAYLFSKRGQF